MPVPLFDYPGICRASFDPASDVTIHEWFDYNPDGPDAIIRGVLDAIFDALRTTGSTKILVIANQTRGAFSPEIQTYIANVQVPRFASDTQLRLVAMVLPEDTISQSYANLWKAQMARNNGITRANFSSKDEALKWLNAA